MVSFKQIRHLFFDVHEFKCMSRELWSGTMSLISGVKKSIFRMLSFISNFITLCYLVFIKSAIFVFLIVTWALSKECLYYRLQSCWTFLLPYSWIENNEALCHQSFWITLTVIFVYLLLEWSVISNSILCFISSRSAFSLLMVKSTTIAEDNVPA